MQLELEVSKKQWRPDESLDVTLVAHTAETVHAEFYLSLGLAVRSSGADYRAKVSGGVRRRMKVEAGTHRYPLTLEFPNGPFSYRGQALGIFWYVTAEARAGGRVYRRSVPIDLVYAPTPLPAPRAPHGPELHIKTSRSRFDPYKALSLSVQGLFLLAAMNVTFFAMKLSWLFLVGLIPIVGAWAWFRSAMKKAKPAAPKEPRVTLQVDPNYVSPGERQTIVIEVEATEPMQIGKIAGSVELVETTRIAESPNSFIGPKMQKENRQDFAAKRLVALRAELDFGEPSVTNLEPGQSRTFATSIKLPDNAPTSMNLGLNEIKWKMQIEIQTDGDPIAIRRNLIVLPTPHSQSDSGNPVARAVDVGQSDEMRLPEGALDRDDDEEIVFDHDEGEPELVEEPLAEEASARA